MARGRLCVCVCVCVGESGGLQPASESVFRKGLPGRAIFDRAWRTCAPGESYLQEDGHARKPQHHDGGVALKSFNWVPLFFFF